MIVQNGNTLIIQNFMKNTKLTIIKQNGVIINFTNELGETVTVARLNEVDLNQLITFLMSQ